MWGYVWRDVRFSERGEQQRCVVSLFTLGASKPSQPELSVC